MWRSPLPKGILGETHLAHMIVSSVPSSRDLRRSESVNPGKLNTRSAVALTAGIVRNWRAITEIRDPSSFLPITVLIGMEGICSQSCISSLVLSVFDLSGEMFVVSAGDTILQNKLHNQTWYKIRVWVQHDQGEGLLLASREKTGHGDSSRQSWNRWSQWVVGSGCCRWISWKEVQTQILSSCRS